jgi:hypothetical protein
MTLAKADAKLWCAAEDGEAPLWGLPGTEAKWPGGQLCKIPPEAVASVRELRQGVRLLDGTPSGAGPSLRLSPEKCWWDIRVESAAVQRLWPRRCEDAQDDAAHAASMSAKVPPPEAESQPGSEPTPAISAPADAPSAHPPNPPAKPTYSDGALAGWFLLRVNTWPKTEPPPNEDEDLVAARSYFDRVPRGRFRVIRREKVPESWRTPGPRRPPMS